MRSRMNRGRLRTAGLLLLAQTACIRYGGPSDLRRDLSREAGVKLDCEFGVTVTRTGIALARLFTDDDEVPLKGVRRVEVGVYRVLGLRGGLDAPRRLELPELADLTPVVRLHEEGEDVFVLVRQDEDEQIRQMVVVAAENDEWVLVRIKGRLTRTFEQAMRMAFDEIDRPEKYEAAIAAYHAAEDERGGL